MSDKKKMIEELKEIVKPYIQDEKGFEEMHEGTDSINDLKINSANLVDVILDIEDKYDITRIIHEFNFESILDTRLKVIYAYFARLVTTNRSKLNQNLAKLSIPKFGVLTNCLGHI